MLAVVQDQQQLPVSHKLLQCVGHAAAGLLLHAQHAGHGLRHPLSRLLGVLQRRQLNKPHTVRVVLNQLGAQLRRQAGFTNAPGAKQGDQAVLQQQLAQLRQHRRPTNKPIQRLGQVVGRGGE